jgi:hypothetical protein
MSGWLLAAPSGALRLRLQRLHPLMETLSNIRRDYTEIDHPVYKPICLSVGSNPLRCQRLLDLFHLGSQLSG